MEIGLMILLVISWSFIVYKCVRAIFFQNKVTRKSTNKKSYSNDAANAENTFYWDPITESFVSNTGYSYSLKDQKIIYPNPCGLSESEKLGFKD